MNYIFLTDKVCDELKNRYSVYKKESNSNAEFNSYINEIFNPSNRGIIYNKIHEKPLKIKIWSSTISLTLEEWPERNGLKAIDFKNIDIEKFNLMLKFCNVLEGEWDFALLYSQVESGADLEYLKEESSFNVEKNKFDKFSEYWKSYDLVTEKREEKAREEKEKSKTKFSKLAVNFDNNTVIFKLQYNDYKFKEGQRITMSSLNNSGVDSKHITIGDVINYDISLDQLVVVCLELDILLQLAENKKNTSGYISIDDIGTMSMLKRQKTALKKLFDRETANIGLKDFIPNIYEADINKKQVISDNEFSEYYEEMNKSQQEAVKRSLECKDIYLIQGPPGTGKTTVICEIIRYLSKKGKDILVSSQNHLAVDNVLQQIGDEEYIRAIRLGKEDKIELGCEKFSLTNRVKDIQQRITQRLLNCEQEYNEINIKLENDENIYNCYKELQNDIKVVLSLVNSYKEHNFIKAEFHDKKLKYEDKEDLAKNQLNEIEEKFQKNKQELKFLINIVDKNNFNRESIQKLSNLIVSCDIDENSVQITHIYTNVLEALQKVIRTAKENEIKIKDYITNLNELELIFKEHKDRILSLGAQFETASDSVKEAILDKINEEKENLKNFKYKYRSKDYDLKLLISKRNHIEDEINHWKEQADTYKLMVEDIISKTSNEYISKKDFIELVELRTELLEKLDNRIDLLKMIQYIPEYDKMSKLENELSDIQLNLKSIEENLGIESKVLSAIDSKIETYKKQENIDFILKYNNISIYDLDKDFVHNMKAFVEEYDNLSHKLKLFNSTKELRKNWSNELKTYQPSFEDMYIGVSNVVCSTCSGIAAANNNYFLEKEFDYVIIDEAAKCFSSELIIPMVKGKKIILVGDHKQISPIIEKEILEEMEAEKEFTKEELNAYLKSSLFGIMFKDAPKELKTVLNTQYRMNADISRFVSKRFYDSNLVDGKNIINKIHGINELINGMYWVDTGSNENSTEIKCGNSYYNEKEIQITITLLKWLDNKLTSRKNVGIISPYRVHTSNLRDQLVNHDFLNMDIEINTIDAFQGREKQIIIMNCVRNNLAGNFGHTSGSARMNVAISRAQELLFIIGNEDFIESNKGRANSLYDLLEYLKKSNNILNLDFFQC
ncbi:MAG: AAA domain-containing protein [Clostridium sp.]|uniref:DEAD/DEAH box helicase n=1 Tax=Clostridium sp. TaxID=1506 RepID=UPI0039EA0BD8